MGLEEVDFVETFIDKLCFSLAKYLNGMGNCFPRNVEIYNTKLETFKIIKDKVQDYIQLFVNSRTYDLSFFYRESSDFPEIQKDTFYVDVGQFFEIYKRRKSDKKNFRF